MCKRPFTLIEMLVVIAIIGILAGLLSGPVMNSLKQGQVTACTNNLRQCGIMIQLYRNANNSAYPLWLSGTEYGGNRKIFICPLDASKGKEGSRPDWIADMQFAETNDMPDAALTEIDSRERGSYPPGTYKPQDGWEAPKQIKAFSYMYEFCGAPAPAEWASDPDYALPLNATWQQFKFAEMRVSKVRNYEGAWEDRNVSQFVPVVRCYHHNDNRGTRNLDDNDRILNYRVNGQVNNSPPNYWWEVAN